MDIQTILVIILAILTVNLVIVGVFVVLVLKEFRETMQKANGILDNLESVSDFLSNPMSLFGGLISSVMGGYKAVNSIRSLRKEDE